MPLDEAYFVWLYSQVGSVETINKSRTYFKLLHILHGKEFTWTIDKDANRAQDGKDLRKEFLAATKTKVSDQTWLDEPCSVLEMMVALAWKLEFDGGGTQAEWFWVLIDNLGLRECTDANPPEEVIVDHILNKLINRDYAANGAGGLFPLHDNNAEDQRDVELFYQAEAYILQNVSL